MNSVVFSGSFSTPPKINFLAINSLNDGGVENAIDTPHLFLGFLGALASAQFIETSIFFPEIRGVASTPCFYGVEATLLKCILTSFCAIDSAKATLLFLIENLAGAKAMPCASYP